MGNFGAAPSGRPEMAFNAFNMAFNAGGRFLGSAFFGKAVFVGQPFSMKRILREGRFSGERFSIKRGEGALRAP